MKLRLSLFFLLCAGAVAARLAGANDTWQGVTWQGESALRSESEGRLAVVSLARARLMYFGPAGGEANVILAPPSRENRNRLGGHRLWLGPQSTWAKIWPPPDAWEYLEAETVSQESGVLRLGMAATGDGWPRLMRTYHWQGGRLVCGAEFSRGARPAQFVQILQVPPAMAVAATAQPDADHPAGYVQLFSTAGSFARRFADSPHVVRTGNSLALRHTGEVIKLGFRPQTLTGRLGNWELQVSRGASTGETVGEPDEGFHTQVYLSAASEAFTELEQLSPLFAPGKQARFEMVLTLVPR
ncbi:MAG TPA: hypothetical protein VG734_04465 [Lacunisphaera sp.]|nr:hypothetical protein [Lacunisphaera sp.]